MLQKSVPGPTHGNNGVASKLRRWNLHARPADINQRSHWRRETLPRDRGARAPGKKVTTEGWNELRRRGRRPPAANFRHAAFCIVAKTGSRETTGRHRKSTKGGTWEPAALVRGENKKRTEIGDEEEDGQRLCVRMNRERIGFVSGWIR